MQYIINIIHTLCNPRPAKIHVLSSWFHMCMFLFLIYILIEKKYVSWEKLLNFRQNISLPTEKHNLILYFNLIARSVE